MRILVFVFHFPPISGGGSVVSFDIVTALANLGHQVIVLVPDVEWKEKIYEPAIDPKITVIRVKTPSRTNLKIAAKRCYKNLQKEGELLGKEKKFDFIFTIFHPFHFVPNAAVSCGKKLGIPVIIKIDDAVYEKSSGLKSLQRSIEKQYNKKSLNGATRILVANENTKNLMSMFYDINNEKIFVLPNGINLSYFKSKPAKRQNLVVFSGMMYYHRGLDILLEAAPMIIENVVDTKFVLLGDGPEMKKLQDEVITKNLGSNVEFKGWIDRKDIPEYLSKAVVGIGPLKLTPVTAQALPIKVLEYMASSLPIIAKRGTLPDEVLQDGKNGYFINDTMELAEKIVTLLKDPLLGEKLGDASYKMVQKFSWENIANSIIKYYKES